MSNDAPAMPPLSQGSASLDQGLATIRNIALVGTIVFLACLFGIFTRPLGFLAAIWPANAILLGLFVRNPQRASPWGWAAAASAYMAADLATGADPLTALWLNGANMASVVVGFLLFRRLSEGDRHLRRPLSVLYLFIICCAGGLAAAAIGAGVGPAEFGQGFWSSFAFWFTAELVNSIIVLPVMLSAPRLLHGLGPAGWRSRRQPLDAARAAPLLAVVFSLFAGLMVGGPGAIAFPMPALLWCALTYDVFPTVVLTLVVSIIKMIMLSAGTLQVPVLSEFIDSTMSFYLGITFLALGPLTVASVSAARNELLRKFDYAANHDSLTGAMARGAFMLRAEDLFAKAHAQDKQAALLMLDIDHFKQINDKHGHPAGDRSLAAFAAAISAKLRAQDAFGRLGGEEFGVFIPWVTPAEANEIAQRLRAEVAQLAVELENGVIIRMTVSIGLAHLSNSASDSFAQMLFQADTALYAAKGGGRDCVEVA